MPLAKLAARVMVGEKLTDLGFTEEIVPVHIAVKEAVFPFAKFPGVDTLLGPEMKSTGEVMGIDTSFGVAFAKAQLGAGVLLPLEGTAFLSVEDADKAGLIPVAQRLAREGFRLIATRGTAAYLSGKGIADRGHQQGPGRQPARRRRDASRPHPSRHQHAEGQRRAARLVPAAPRRARVEGAVLHDDRRRRRRRRGHRVSAAARRSASARSRSTTALG